MKKPFKKHFMHAYEALQWISKTDNINSMYQGGEGDYLCMDTIKIKPSGTRTQNGYNSFVNVILKVTFRQNEN